MKCYLVLLAFLISLSLHGQPDFDGHTWKAPYHLPTPDGWSVERFQIPINFAPQIPYKGIEDIRFSPGWANSKSEEYWTYAFLWYLDNSPKTDANTLAENIKIYYSGLIKSNTDSAKAATGNPVPIISSFKKQRAEKGDLETYAGTIEMMDYMKRKPITLNCRVHLRTCREGKTILFYALSPKPFTHPNWVNLHKLWFEFRCAD